MSDQNTDWAKIIECVGRLLVLEHNKTYELFMCAYLRFLNQGTL